MTLIFDPKINGFPGLAVEHFYVKSGDRFMRKTDKNTNATENPKPAT